MYCISDKRCDIQNSFSSVTEKYVLHQLYLHCRNYVISKHLQSTGSKAAVFPYILLFVMLYNLACDINRRRVLTRMGIFSKDIFL